MASPREDEYLTAMRESERADPRGPLRRAVVNMVAETGRGALIGGGMAGTIAPLRVPLALFGGVTGGTLEAFRQVSTAYRGLPSDPMHAPGEDFVNRTTRSGALSGGISLAGDALARYFGVPYSARTIALSGLIAAAGGASGEVFATGVRRLDRTAAERGGYLALMRESAPAIMRAVRSAASDPGGTIRTNVVDPVGDSIRRNIIEPARDLPRRIETEASRRIIQALVPDNGRLANTAVRTAAGYFPRETLRAAVGIARAFPEQTASYALGPEAGRFVRQARELGQGVSETAGAIRNYVGERLSTGVQRFRDALMGSRAAISDTLDRVNLNAERSAQGAAGGTRRTPEPVMMRVLPRSGSDYANDLVARMSGVDGAPAAPPAVARASRGPTQAEIDAIDAEEREIQAAERAREPAPRRVTLMSSSDLRERAGFSEEAADALDRRGHQPSMVAPYTSGDLRAGARGDRVRAWAIDQLARSRGTRMNLMGPVDARTVAVADLRNEQAAALTTRTTARTRGDRDGMREANERFRETALAARERIAGADAEELSPLLKEWKRRDPRTGRMQTVRRQQFWR